MPAPAILRLLRPHQWAKNALVFVALLTSHRWRDGGALLAAALAFAAFCATSSAVYVFNDARDVDDDRRDAAKRKRPFASGELEPRIAWWLVPLLLAVAAACAWPLPVPAGVALAVYAATAFAYCLLLKRLLWLAHHQGHPQALMLALITFVAMVGSCALSGVAGAAVPLALKRLGADPATASSIFLTTATDVVSMGSFLGLATLILL